MPNRMAADPKLCGQFVFTRQPGAQRDLATANELAQFRFELPVQGSLVGALQRPGQQARIDVRGLALHCQKVRTFIPQSRRCCRVP